LKSFAGESQARNRYDMFAKAAKKEGYEQIAEIFTTTALQEKEHAKRFFKFLEGGEVEITAKYPAGKVGTTSENLKAAANGEAEEWQKLYPHFAEVAKTEGFDEIATAYEKIAIAEAEHERQYRKLLENIEKDQVFKRANTVKWYCGNCGFVTENENAPAECPACLHPKAYFRLQPNNF
jgi:rubrerythrin